MLIYDRYLLYKMFITYQYNDVIVLVPTFLSLKLACIAYFLLFSSSMNHRELV